MIRLAQAIVAVMSCTVASGVAGEIVGVSVGTFAPSFVLWLQKRRVPDPSSTPPSSAWASGSSAASSSARG